MLIIIKGQNSYFTETVLHTHYVYRPNFINTYSNEYSLIHKEISCRISFGSEYNGNAPQIELLIIYSALMFNDDMIHILDFYFKANTRKKMPR